MKLGARNIIGGKPKHIFDEMKKDNHPRSKKNFMKVAKEIAKKHSK